MFNDQKIKGYVFVFLAFCVFSSKNVIIYNEETLVALSFCGFVYFCVHYFGNTIKESLDERALSIKEELQNFLHLKRGSLIELKQEHNRIARLKSVLPALGSFTEQQLHLFGLSGGQALTSAFAQQLQQKLGNLSSSRSALQQRLQRHIANNIQALVLARVEQSQSSGGEEHLDIQTIRSSIQSLKKKN